MQPILRLKFSKNFSQKLAKLKKTNPRSAQKVLTKLELFQQNQKHPSLRLHKLSGNLNNVWSLSVTKDFRLVFTYNNMPYFFNLGTHKEIYKQH